MVPELVLSHIPPSLECSYVIKDDEENPGLSVNSMWYSSNVDIEVPPWKTVTVTLVLSGRDELRDGRNEQLAVSFPRGAPLQATCRISSKDHNLVIVDMWNSTHRLYTLDAGTKFLCLMDL